MGNNEYKKALGTIDAYFKNRQDPNKIGAFTDSLRNEIFFALRLGINQLEGEYGFSNTKIKVGGFPLAFIEMLSECVMLALHEGYRDTSGEKASPMDIYFNEYREFNNNKITMEKFKTAEKILESLSPSCDKSTVIEAMEFYASQFGYSAQQMEEYGSDCLSGLAIIDIPPSGNLQQKYDKLKKAFEELLEKNCNNLRFFNENGREIEINIWKQKVGI